MRESGTDRRLAAVLYADIVGYSRLMAHDESETIHALKDSRKEIERLIGFHGGRLVDAAGDSALAEFPTATGAVETALDIQAMAGSKNAEIAAERRMHYRIGVHLGEVHADEGRIYGDAVNIAARIQGLAETGGICLSSAVFEQVKNKLPLGYQDLGGRKVKNIPYTIRVYRIGSASGQIPATTTDAPGAAAARYAGDRRSTRPQRASVAVLPFDVFTPDPSGNAYGDILATEIIRSLSRAHGLRVASRLATAGYRGRAVDPRNIGHELGVNYVLSGNLRLSGDRARVMLEINDTQSGSQLWTRKWKVSVKELLDEPEPIAEAIVAVFEGEFVRAEVMSARDVPDDNLDARGLIHKARAWFLGSYAEAPLLEASRLSQRAIELQPSYAVAHAALALVSVELMLNAWGGPPERSEQRARESADRAIDLQPDNPICLENYGLVWLHLGEFGRAERALRRAVEIAPTDLVAWAHLGFALGWGGADDAQARESNAILERIYETAPEHPLAGFWPFFHSSALVRGGRSEDAIAECRLGVESQPGFAFTWLALANALALEGQVAEAQDALARVFGANDRMTPALYAELVRRMSRGIDAVEINLEGLRELGAL